MREDRQRLSEELKMDQESALRNDKIDVDIKANLEYRERERAIVAHQKKVRQAAIEQTAVRMARAAFSFPWLLASAFVLCVFRSMSVWLSCARRPVARCWRIFASCKAAS